MHNTYVSMTRSCYYSEVIHLHIKGSINSHVITAILCGSLGASITICPQASVSLYLMLRQLYLADYELP